MWRIYERSVNAIKRATSLQFLNLSLIVIAARPSFRERQQDLIGGSLADHRIDFPATKLLPSFHCCRALLNALT